MPLSPIPLASLAKIGALILCLAVAGCATTVRFQSGDAATTISGALFKPDGPGPFGAVVMLHGCAGIRQHYVSSGIGLKDAGYVALLVDSFGPRGISNICSDSRTMANMVTDRTHDAYGALRYLKTLPFVDRNRVAVMGWSHGGWTVLETLRSYPYQTSPDQFRVGIAYYPYCRTSVTSRFRAPLLVLIGSNDDWTPAARCQDMERLREPDTPPILLRVYEGAYHDFDDASLGPRARSYIGHIIAYNADAAMDAEARVQRFLSEYLKGTAR